MRNAAEKALKLARKHIGNGAAMDSSARLCLADAVAAFDADDFGYSLRHAQRSLRYSVGILHDDYRTVADLGQGEAA